MNYNILLLYYIIIYYSARSVIRRRENIKTREKKRTDDRRDCREKFNNNTPVHVRYCEEKVKIILNLQLVIIVAYIDVTYNNVGATIYRKRNQPTTE